MKKFKTMALATLLIGLPLLAQTPNQATNSTTPFFDPGNTTITTPNVNQNVNSPVNNTGAETAGAAAGNATGTATGTGAGTGTGFAPIAPASPGNTPAATNPMGGWQGK